MQVYQPWSHQQTAMGPLTGQRPTRPHRLVRAVVGMAMEQGAGWSGSSTVAVTIPNRNG